MNQRYSGYILPFSSARLVQNLHTTPSTKVPSVKFMATAQFDNNVYFSMHGMFKKIHTIFITAHTCTDVNALSSF